jgi:hypothetical protein
MVRNKSGNMNENSKKHNTLPLLSAPENTHMVLRSTTFGYGMENLSEEPLCQHL